ncbi:hypothetical protein GCM10009584_14350 [Ornithinimicrobium humiphilum]|uniref:Putative DNA-binding protein n=1 Tax=Ornithinimicrobium humiphilum TaxID=125288 RepID=A0A543KKD3_9MICO|nr:ATP-binding protein [Ornithinimicrobium humiphilum]TQM95528.1 putative DNA-binding protein [Ornithinimicrobium humiphilum]
MSFYLGPTRPVTSLSTWEEVELAAQGGLLEENQWVELKKDLGPANKAVNTELAKDLASLSVDGGLLIFGVADDGTPVGCDAEAIIPRISQVAGHGITPALSPVIHNPIPHPEDPGKAVLIVAVPASPVGPHMVDDRYWGRSSHGKQVLSDPDVRRLLLLRAAAQEGFEDRLRALAADDPLDSRVVGGPENGHLYVLAEPLGPIPHPHPLSDADLLREQLRKVSPSGWRSGLEKCSSSGRDPDGAALVTIAEEVAADRERGLTFVSLKDDGRLVVVSGGATAVLPQRGGEHRGILIGLITRLTYQTLQLVRNLSLDAWGYQGPWQVGVLATDLRGLPPLLDALDSVGEYRAADYQRTIVTTPATWGGSGSADEAAEQLLSGFFRGLGIDGWSVDVMLRRHG